MKKLLIPLLICGVLAVSSYSRAQLLVAGVATELAESLGKSLLGAFAGNIFSALFGTPALSAEQAADQLKQHFAQLEKDHEKTKTKTLSNSVYDYIIKRNDPKYTLHDRRNDVRDILYRTNKLEGMLVRLIKDGHFEQYAKDYYVVASTRVTFIGEQTYLEASQEVTENGKRKIVTNHKLMRDGLNIMATEAGKQLQLLANQLVPYIENDKAQTNCLKKPENLPWFAIDGTPLGNQLISYWPNGNHKRDARHQYCYKWAYMDSDVRHHWPSGGLFLNGKAFYANPKNHQQVMYRYKGDGGYWLGIASSLQEAKRHMVARGVDQYYTKIGHPSVMIRNWSDIVKHFGTEDQKKAVAYIHKWFLELEKPL